MSLGDGPKTSAARPNVSTEHPAWIAFIRFCRDLKHGEIERLAIQDGVPVLATLTRQKIKFPS
jgi:hypothetical protein